MPALQWNESYSVHNKTIDSQHKVLFEIFNKLHVECSNNDREALQSALLELHKYTVYHFEAEERFMVSVTFKGVIMHKIEHKYFVKRIQEVIDQEGDQSGDQLRVLITFLSSWLIQHVLGEDKKIPVIANARHGSNNCISGSSTNKELSAHG